MCSSNTKLQQGIHVTPSKGQINGRPALQPTCNRIPTLERHHSFKKLSPKSPPTPPASLPRPVTPINATKTKPSSLTPPASPKPKSPRQPALKRGSDPSGLNSSLEKVFTPRGTAKSSCMPKKTKKCSPGLAPSADLSSLNYSSSLIVEAPGSIAAARREQVAIMQEQRKMRIAHYGRTKSGKFDEKSSPVDPLVITSREEKRCSFITPNSDPSYVEYHDREWGVPVHDDKRLFELLVMTGAQVGSDWTTVLRKRQEYRDAFSGYDAEEVAKFSEKKIASISAYYGIDASQVRGVVDNSIRIMEIKKELGSFDKYMWGFVNHKAISTQYKTCHKIPVKTSKSESISKDMVRRGFRLVGPTVIHSFMQATGLTNDHLITCPRHLQCTALASHQPTVAPAL